MRTASIHRFHDTVAVSLPGTGETVYMVPDAARALARALLACAENVDLHEFTSSNFGTRTVAMGNSPGTTIYSGDSPRRVIGRSRNLRGVLDRARKSAVMSVKCTTDTRHGGDYPHRLETVHADGSRTVSHWASATICGEWCANRRRSWGMVAAFGSEAFRLAYDKRVRRHG